MKQYWLGYYTELSYSMIEDKGEETKAEPNPNSNVKFICELLATCTLP